MDDRITARQLKGAFWVVMMGTITAALVLAAVDRLLLASAVCFLGILPAAPLAWWIERRTPPRSSAEKRATGLRLGFRIAAVGAAATTVGGALLIIAPDSVGHLQEVLLSVGATLLLGGVTAQRYVRSHDRTAAEGRGSAERASTAPTRRGVTFLLVRKNHYGIALWAAAMSALAGGPALFGAAPRPLVGATVLLLAGLPLAASRSPSGGRGIRRAIPDEAERRMSAGRAREPVLVGPDHHLYPVAHPSLARTRPTCVFTVASARKTSPPISALLSPCATSRTI